MDNFINLGTNLIHSNAFVGKNVQFGNYNVVDAFCTIDNFSNIGDNNYFGPFTAIGAQPEDRTNYETLDNGHPKVSIGDNNKLFSHVTIQSGTNLQTTIGDNNFIMSYVSVGHDSQISNFVNLSPRVVLGGHVKVLDNSTLGMGTIVHQNVKIGGFSMIGMGSVVNRNINPFSLSLDRGNPPVQIGLNFHALDKNKIDLTWTDRYSHILESREIPDSVPEVVSKIFLQWFKS